MQPDLAQAPSAPFCVPPIPQAASTSRIPAARLALLWRNHAVAFCAAAIILTLGLSLRILPVFGVPDDLTLDEALYINNVSMVKAVGPFEYSALVQHYVVKQARTEMVMLPPTRCVYILLGWAWSAAFHCSPGMALRHVAAMFSCLSFVIAGIFAFRMGGTRMGLMVGAMMAVAPLELMMAHRELVDGVLAFWALLSLWLLWENLQRPPRLGWLAAYAGSITFMVLTKENAFFATVALGSILCVAAAFPGLKLGSSGWAPVIATVAGGLMGIAVLLCLTGGPETMIETYRLLVTKAEKMRFAYESGGGPWFRYIIDLMLVSPAALLPAIGGIFALRWGEKESRQGVFLLLFIVFSCAVMVNVKNGMNVRYATMWDMPMRYLAAGPLLQLGCAFRRKPGLGVMLALGLVCALELRQYFQIFVEHDVGEPITRYLMQAVDILRVAK